MSALDISKSRKVAQAILDGHSYDEQRAALKYLDLFVPHAAPTMMAYQGEVEYVESLYLQLRQFAFEWLTNQRLLDIEARLEGLESPNGGQLGDHR